MKRVLNLILTHQGEDAVNLLLEWWRRQAPDAEILLVTSNDAIDKTAIQHPQHIAVHDPRLHTRDHQRERQSYSGVFAAASRWLAGREFDYVHFAEYDHLPLISDLNARQVALMEAEGADLMGFEADRVDGTNQPHYLHHARDPRFAAFWPTISCRANPHTVMSMFGSGSFWRREAFDRVAAIAEPFPIYLEIWLPTVAHHLGYRFRGFTDPAAAGFIDNLRDFSGSIPRARAAGAWTIHPVKSLVPAMLDLAR